ncbi:MAG: hypothetical protein KGH66_02510 [Candidatus Micrarchaeota archaeon]|nr:hypothetical protein [Candidatus Micrarchaeota archaeon]
MQTRDITPGQQISSQQWSEDGLRIKKVVNQATSCEISLGDNVSAMERSVIAKINHSPSLSHSLQMLRNPKGLAAGERRVFNLLKADLYMLDFYGESRMATISRGDREAIGKIIRNEDRIITGVKIVMSRSGATRHAEEAHGLFLRHTKVGDDFIIHDGILKDSFLFSFAWNRFQAIVWHNKRHIIPEASLPSGFELKLTK